jgi:ribosome-associated toxin RatA of RatAB toxin-antitoxin module
MYISNQIKMRGEWPVIWKLSSEIEHWPEYLPHYRKVKILEEYPENQTYQAAMSAWRDFLPVFWHSQQIRFYGENPSDASVKYFHTGGVTNGMVVVWSFTPTGKPDELLVEITHNWNPRWPLIGKLASRLICQLIVHNIADKTLEAVKERAYANSKRLATRSREAAK